MHKDGGGRSVPLSRGAVHLDLEGQMSLYEGPRGVI